MKCGHTAQAVDDNGKPICAICLCEEVEDKLPNLDGRKAKCLYCDKETRSDFGLPFFGFEPDKEYDKYYCGCEGWD